MRFKQKHLLDVWCAAANLHTDRVVDLQKIDTLHNNKAQCVCIWR